MPAEAELVVVRPEAWHGRARKLRVILDGDELGRVRHGETERFAIPPGEHQVYVKMDWVESDSVAFTCASGERLVLECFAPTFTWRQRFAMTAMQQADTPFTLELRREP